MKLPYRIGDSFALPLGDGSMIPARIIACEHHVVTIEAGGATLRVYDGALVLRRWRGATHLGDGPSTTALRAYAQGDTSSKPLSPAKAERAVAELCGVRTFDASPIAVQTSAIRGVVRSSAGVRLNRVDSETLAHVSHAAALTIAAPVKRWMQTFPKVTRLTLDAPCTFEGIEEAFPILRALRIGDGVKRVDLADVVRLRSLIELDISHAAVRGFEELASMKRLRALRLAHIGGLRTLEPIGELELHTLAIEHQPQLRDVEPLLRCTSLEQLELLGMWQFTIDECARLNDLVALKRAVIDIGGRRKNVELYSRARWAYPWPTFSDARLTSVAPLERID